MSCPKSCLAPFGGELSDVGGPGIMISYGIHTALALILGCSYSAIQWRRVRKKQQREGATTPRQSGIQTLAQLLLVGQPRQQHPEEPSTTADALDEIFLSFFDGSLNITIPMLVVLLYWLLSNPSAKIYQNVFSNLFAELSFGSLAVTYALIGANLRRPVRQFLVFLLALVLFIPLSILSITHGLRLVNQEVRPFYSTLGIDCLDLYPELARLQNSAFTTDGWHIFALSTFIVYVCYSISRGILNIRYSEKEVTLSPLLAMVNVGAIGTLHIAICTAAIANTVRLLRYRSTFGLLNEKMTGQAWGDDIWGFGQYLVLFVWLMLVINVAYYLILRIAPSMEGKKSTSSNGLSDTELVRCHRCGEPTAF